MRSRRIGKFIQNNGPAYLALLIIALIGFWPITTGIFSLKNDNIVYFLPYRFNITEIIRSGHLPLWSPYVYMGFPIANDMQSGAWNPLVWLLALAGRYTLTSLSVELLIYLFMAGVGMFKLAREFGYKKIICFTVASSYMFCGFMLDSGQIICWIACASVLPFTYLYFIRIIKNPGAISAVKFAFANCLLIAGGYPSFFIINLYLFLFSCLGAGVYLTARMNYRKLKLTFSYLLLSSLLFLLTGMVMWLSFLDMLPYYRRGHSISLQGALEDSFSISFGLSALAPFVITWANAAFIHGAAIFRNIYFGILLFPLAFYGVAVRRSFISTSIFLFTLACFCCSLGEELPFRKIAFEYLPLMNTFRHPANFRVFVIIGILMLSAKGLQTFFEEQHRSKKFIGAALGLLFLLFIAAAGYYFRADEIAGILRTSNGNNFARLVSGDLFNEAVVINSIVQLIFIAAALIALFKNRFLWYCLLAIFNSILIAQPQIFYSIVSKNSPSLVNQYVRAAPRGFSTTGLDLPIGLKREKEIINNGHFTGLGTFYAKRPILNGSFNNPTILTNYFDFLRDSALVKELSSYTVIFLADTSYYIHSAQKETDLMRILQKKNSGDSSGSPQSFIRIHSFKPNEISFTVESKKGHMVSVFQNNYPGWEASLDDEPTEITTVNHCFIGLYVPGGRHLVILRYKPRWLSIGIFSSLIGIIASGWILFRKRVQRETHKGN